MKRERLGVAESVNAIKDGKIDAFFWVGGLPTAAVTDLANTPGHQDQDDRPRRSGRGDEQEVRQPVRPGHDPEGHLQGHGRRQQAGDGDEHPGRPREHGRQDRLQHRQDDLRPQATTSSRCTRKRSTSSSRTRRRRRRRSRSIPAPRSTSPKRASRSTDASRRHATSTGADAAARADAPAVKSAAALQRAEQYVEAGRRRGQQAEGLARRLRSPGRLRDVGVPPLHAPTRSCRRRRCGRSTSPSCCSCASWSSRSRGAFATASCGGTGWPRRWRSRSSSTRSWAATTSPTATPRRCPGTSSSASP